MNQNDDTETDLQQRFGALKRTVGANTPAWEHCWQAKPVHDPRRQLRVRPSVPAAAAAMVVCLAISFLTRPTNSLARALPPLFEPQLSTEHSDFLAIAALRSWPSDSLSPSHLNLIIP